MEKLQENGRRKGGQITLMEDKPTIKPIRIEERR